MLIQSLVIEDVKFAKPRRFEDDRGYFCEVFNQAAWLAAGVDFKPVQENQSMSRSVGTVRGLHFQRHPFAQSKLVRVVKGRIFDVAVDIRAGSESYGKWVGAELSSDGGEQLFIPVGFAHGFCTLEPDTEIVYLIDNPYSAESDGAILWNDPAISITWPDCAGAVLSGKDANAPKLSEATPGF